MADTDAEAYKLYREPAEYFFNRSLHVYPGFTDPPGYITEASVRARYKSQVRQVARNKQAKHDLTWDEMVENGYVVIGGPDTVREQLEEAARELRIGHLCAMLQFGNMSDELTRYNTKLFGEKVAPGLRTLFSEYADPWWPKMPRRIDKSRNLVYLFGIAGHTELSPAMRAVEAAGWEVVVPAVPGFDGVPGFEPRDEYLGLAHHVLGLARRHGRAAVPGDRRVRRRDDRGRARRTASRGRHGVGLLAPFGIADGGEPGFNIYGTPGGERMASPLRQGCARCVRQAIRALG